MNVKISPRRLSGFITAPLSKSEAHRMLICSALSDSPVQLFIGLDGISGLSDDIEATIRCLKSLGAEIFFTDDGFLHITPINKNKIPFCPELDCNESGSTLRFMLPVAAALCDRAYFTGTGRLPERPIHELMNAMKVHGVNFSSDHLPFEISGKLKPGIYELPGNVSSQYITGLMLGLSILEEKSEIKLISKLKSAAYVDITISSMEKFGVYINKNDSEYKISGNNKFHSPGAISVGGDWSGAAFFLAAGALAGPVSVTGLSIDSKQGDKKILEFLELFGAKISINNNIITVSPEKMPREKIEIDIDPTPDLLPVLAVVAACSDCETKFFNASRLRLKESDRISSTASIVRSLGGYAKENPDELTINGNGNLSGGTANGFHDHRIVMAASVAAIKCNDEVIISDAEAAGKSYPNFFKDYASLGGNANVI